MKYIASKKYKIVCKETCFHIKNIKEENKNFYDDLKQALIDGCRPCKHCLKNYYKRLDTEGGIY